MLARQMVLTLGGSSAAQLADLAPVRIGELWRQYMTAFAGVNIRKHHLCCSHCNVWYSAQQLRETPDDLKRPSRLCCQCNFGGCAECLERWEGDPESKAGRRLDRLFFEALQMWTAVQVGYPDRVKVILGFRD